MEDPESYQELGMQAAERQLENLRFICRSAQLRNNGEGDHHVSQNQIIVTLNMPEIYLSPLMSVAYNRMQAALQFMLAYNILFDSGIRQLRSEFPHVRMVMIDVSNFLSDIVSRAGPNGLDLEPVSKPFRDEGLLCANPKRHIFFDRVHPSAWVHVQLAEKVGDAMRAQLARPPCRRGYHF